MSTPLTELLDDVVDLLSRHRIRHANERQLQDGIEALLVREGFTYRREYLLTAHDKPDFWLPPGLCVEVKIQGRAADVRSQLLRYAASEQVAALLLVTTRQRHAMPRVMLGKAVTTLYLGSALR